ISKEWPAMRNGKTSPAVEARIAAMELGAEKAASERAAVYEQWSASNDERRQGRQGRIAEAETVVPSVIWLGLIIGALIVIASVCFFADANEAWFPQVAMMAATAIIIVSGLLLVRFLERPYENESGSIEPTAMARSLALMHQVPNAPVGVRCD